MMYHCIPIGYSSPSHTKLLENGLHGAVHTHVDKPEKNPEKRHGHHNHPGCRNHVLARWPSDLLHLHASVVEELLHIRKRARDFARQLRAHPALRFVVFHFYRLRCHKTSSLPRSGLAHGSVLSIPRAGPGLALRPRGRSILAGEEGFEPPYPVLETGVLTVGRLPFTLSQRSGRRVYPKSAFAH